MIERDSRKDVMLSHPPGGGKNSRVWVIAIAVVMVSLSYVLSQMNDEDTPPWDQSTRQAMYSDESQKPEPTTKPNVLATPDRTQPLTALGQSVDTPKTAPQVEAVPIGNPNQAASPKKRPIEIPATTITGGGTYEVQENDQLWSIAEKVYGKGWKYKEIIAANSDLIKNENTLLQPGWVLKIPELNGQSKRSKPSSTSSSAGDFQVHQASENDSLWALAQRYYGDGSQWPRIAAANPEKFPDGGTMIKAGWELVIPK